MMTALIANIFSGTVWEIISGSSLFGKFILLVLVFMSFMSWVIIASKWRQYKAVQAASDAFLSTFRKAVRLADAVGQASSHAESPLSRIFLAGRQEQEALIKARNQGGAMQNTVHPLKEEDYEVVEMIMGKTATEEIGKLEGRVVFLATTSGSAPFMGLLGTVVGIMDSFWSIGERGSASLAVVAPGIAEALLATIVGLGAAIPALIAYNWANNKTKYLNDQADAFILEFLARARKEALQ